ncbi:hypothetical protein CDL15_Pgr004484 [Punica granatum]|uniref:Uncharacterized protein n=1 Tax=Punica granatum TaxID=22663 RepID=A0A218WBU4_PUNGR|nr:hypothetical protein CDL15_Pgr004484 [Punica granatum]
MAPVHLILLLGSFLLNFDHFSSFSVGSPFTLREVSRNNVGTMDYAVQLNATNFNAALRDTPALFSMVEFYAHWLVVFASDQYLQCSLCLNFEGFTILAGMERESSKIADLEKVPLVDTK